ncbi:type II toxin-antitoxin system Phd/YefM family antitoxin [uncultured Methylophaga sp.]|uniref:type II toxin-antitoxin system Phd/YefM family antitoxin n=1 Tax=uncultured Methylophaga sp. TaxID=285271 RepID=UPI002613CE93|nr:type II toxin-antitoxin system Phd/YefM family antitoxin [uncultured Methylophaga sp.]
MSREEKSNPIMKSFSIKAARERFIELVCRAQQGETFVITDAGKPVAIMSSINDSPIKTTTRIGFMADQLKVPGDFDRMGKTHLDNDYGFH